MYYSVFSVKFHREFVSFFSLIAYTAADFIILKDFMVTPKQIQKIAELSKIKLKEGDEARFSKDLASIIDFFSVLEEVNTENVVPTSQVTGLLNVTKSDEIEMCSYEKELVECTPHQTENNSVKIPKIM